MSMTNILKRLFQDDGSGQMLRPEIVPGNKPIGEIFFYAGTDIPSGALRLDGQSIVGVSAAFPDFKAWVVEHAVLCTLDEYTAELTAKEGQCAKFGWDASSDTLRLPTVTGFIGAAASTDEIGKAELAGLPNAIGEVSIPYCGETGGGTSGTGALRLLPGLTTGVTTSNNGPRNNRISLDLSRSSPIFGRSPNSVTPPSVRYPFFIQVYNSAVGVSEAQAAEFAGLVDGLRQDVPGMAASAAGPNVSAATVIKISVPSSGTEYPALADGYIRVSVDTAANYGWIAVYDNDVIVHNTPVINGYQTVYTVRALRGSVYKFTYGNVNIVSIDFIYANGNAPE